MDIHASAGTLALERLPWRGESALKLSAAVLLASLLVGVAVAADTQIGVAFLLGLLYLPVALTNLRLGLALWFPLVFLEGLPAFNLAAKAGGLLVVGIWFAALGDLRAHLVAVLRRNAVIWLSLAGLLLWCSLSVLWAEDRSMVYADLWHWYAVALLMLIVATTVDSARVVSWMIMAFVLGAVLTVGQGIASGGLTTSDTALSTAAHGRLIGGQGDPNYLAAGIVPAMVLALSLRATIRAPIPRWLLLGALLMLSLGWVASESRGGMIAAIAAAIAALVVFKHRRAWVLASLTIVVGVATAWFAVSPTAWERVSNFDNGGSGRSDLWVVAWRMAEENPAHGVGLNNYPVVGGDYVNEPGELQRAELVVDKAQVVHNAFLQLLAETGVIGLGMLLTVAFGSMYAAWRAARRFRRIGDLATETLAQGVIVATVGLLAASFFISNTADKRLWVLYGMGPALMAVAAAQERRSRTVPAVTAAQESAPRAPHVRP